MRAAMLRSRTTCGCVSGSERTLLGSLLQHLAILLGGLGFEPLAGSFDDDGVAHGSAGAPTSTPSRPVGSAKAETAQEQRHQAAAGRDFQ